MLEIDGSYLEGGGSIARLAVAFSVIKKIPVKIFNIRVKRKNPGLKEQHLQAIKAVAELCNGKLKNTFLGSTEIEFFPAEIEKDKLTINIGTAGSIGLVLQCVMLPCFFSKHKTVIEIKGGATFGKFAPNLLYTKHVLLPLIKKLGFNAELEIKRHGFYPKGGADVIVTVNPVNNTKELYLEERGSLKEINGVSIASDYLRDKKVAERTKEEATRILIQNFKCQINIKEEYVNSLCAGSGLLLYANFDNTIIADDSLGERGKKSEIVAKEAATSLISQLKTNATVDIHMVDQIVPYLTFANGSIIAPKLTTHAKTNIWLIEKFIDKKFIIKGNTISVK